MIDHNDIESLFAPLLERIQSPVLRQQVVDCWVEGCRQGNWETLDDLRAMPFTLLTDCRGVSFIEHTQAVTTGALALYEAQATWYRQMPYDVVPDWLIAGGLLHDIGKLMEIEPDGAGSYRKSYAGRCARHPISGAILAGSQGLPQEIINIIACHAKEGDGRPQRVETVFIHEADFATFNPLVMLKKGDLI